MVGSCNKHFKIRILLMIYYFQHLELVKKRELEEAEMLKTPRVKQTHKVAYT